MCIFSMCACAVSFFPPLSLLAGLPEKENRKLVLFSFSVLVHDGIFAMFFEVQLGLAGSAY